MKILINLDSTDNFQEVDIEETSSVLELKMSLQTIFNIPFNEMELKLKNQIIQNPNLQIKDLKIGDNVLLLKQVQNQNIGFSQIFQPQNISNNNNNSLGSLFDQFMSGSRTNNNNRPNIQQPFSIAQQFSLAMRNLNNRNNQAKEFFIKERVKELKDRFLTTPEDLQKLFDSDPNLAEAIVSGNDSKLEEIVKKKINEAEEKYKKDQIEYMRLMKGDQNDPNVQKKIAEIIRMKNINENLKYAEEFLPETLFPVHMLYINIEINKKKVIALVDTGAQSTTMCKKTAEECNLMNLCDERYQGIATGVGTSRILGAIHAAQLKINDKYLMCKITVIENNAIGCIFGLDNMRSHGCIIDLKKGSLIFPTAGIEAKFLSDGEIKKLKVEERENLEKEEIKKAKEESLKKK